MTNLALADGHSLYTPSKFEWLVVEMDAITGSYSFYNNHFMISLGTAGRDIVVINVSYSAEVDRSNMNRAISIVRKTLETRAKEPGWKWLKIKENVILVD